MTRKQTAPMIHPVRVACAVKHQLGAFGSTLCCNKSALTEIYIRIFVILTNSYYIGIFMLIFNRDAFSFYRI